MQIIKCEPFIWQVVSNLLRVCVPYFTTLSKPLAEFCCAVLWYFGSAQKPHWPDESF